MEFDPWLFGPRTDALAFTGTAVFALALVALRRFLGWPEELPEWGWLAFVVGVDVAHVYATLFRTYLDGQELARHRARYVGIPALVYVSSVLLHLQGGAVFFRVLAYLAVWHFVRQQVGWAALYRARAPSTRADALIDQAAIYAATLYPLLYWHAHAPEKQFAWLIPGDFVDVSASAKVLLGPSSVVWLVALFAFAARQLYVAFVHRRVALGKTALVATTAATWYVGIVGSTGDFDFTVTNVLVHGVPYMVLLHSYGRASGKHHGSLGAAIVGRGAVVFVGLLAGCALAEEAGWDRLVWHDHEWLFGATDMTLGDRSVAAALLVPLLALPQAVHYVLDGLLWRRREPAIAVLAEWPSRHTVPGR